MFKSISLSIPHSSNLVEISSITFLWGRERERESVKKSCCYNRWMLRPRNIQSIRKFFQTKYFLISYFQPDFGLKTFSTKINHHIYQSVNVFFNTLKKLWFRGRNEWQKKYTMLLLRTYDYYDDNNNNHVGIYPKYMIITSSLNIKIQERKSKWKILYVVIIQLDRIVM